MASRFPVVGIGASAGGVEALEAFFAATPAETGMAFVVVMHLDPNHESWLADIIGRRTKMAVAPARDGEQVEPQRVYVLPPGFLITIEAGILKLRPRGPGPEQRAAIDIFFISLAEDRGEDAVGIVLSGGGSDGTLGIKAIKEAGGLTVAQGVNETAPRFRDMPESAASTGLVDLVVPVEQIPERLIQYFGSASAIEGDRIAAATNSIYELLRARLGHDFREYKEKTFGRRVQRRMQVLSLTNIDAYVDRLRQEPEEVGLLFRDLLIGVTSFFRDVDAFRALEIKVMPELFANKNGDHEVRIWVPGCASGEEVYSLAILACEIAEKTANPPKVQIFGTDIDERALAIARTGHYPQSMLVDVAPARLKRFFVRDQDGYRVSRELRDLCIFSPHSVLRDPPFSRLDLISCRNLLIYLKGDLQARIIPIFHYGLRPDGYLFLGLSESITRHGDLFAPLDSHNRLYRRRDLVSSAANLLPQMVVRGMSRYGRPISPLGPAKPDILRAATAAVAERFAPAYVVVTEQGDALHYSARTGKYLEQPAGAPSKDLLAMARRGLRADLRATLRKAVETHAPAISNPVNVEIDGSGTQTVTITAQPIAEGGDTAYLVVFTDIGSVQSRAEADAQSIAVEDGTVQQLHKELVETKHRLQAAIEELETSNEELTSSNEEMLSVNEELQSANEELEASKEETQSINEELQTVNSELHRKVEDLDQSNNYLRNLFDSTKIGMIFLDRDLIIRTFTPASDEVFSLIPSDRGRPLTDIANQLDGVDLAHDVRAVLASEQFLERRITARKGTVHYLMRLMIYRNSAGRADGVLATFTDISSVVASEEQLRDLTAELSHRVKNTLAVVGSIATQTGGHSGGKGEFLQKFLGRLHSLAGTHELLSLSEWADAPLGGLIERELSPYAEIGGDRLTIAGPAISLTPRASLTLGMIVHELATNSTKYGALSVSKGKLVIGWKMEQQGPASQMRLDWHESNGPALKGAPSKYGFGIKLIERSIQFELGGSATISYDKAGLRCVLTVPAGPNVIVSGVK